MQNWKNGKDVYYNFDIKKDYNNISKKACAIITRIYLDYIASNEESKKIEKILYENTLKKEELSRQKYSTNELFKDKEKSVEIENSNEINKSLVEYKESLFNKIMNKIKNFFKK